MSYEPARRVRSTALGAIVELRAVLCHTYWGHGDSSVGFESIPCRALGQWLGACRHGLAPCKRAGPAAPKRPSRGPRSWTRSQLLDLMFEFFADDGHWARGCYDDGNGGHCLVGALLHLSRKHRLPAAPVIALLQDAMPRPGLP